MSQIANITVFDGAGTPVSHTLTAMEIARAPDGSVTAKWQEITAGVPAYASISMMIKKTILKSGVTKTERTVIVPVMESVSGQNSQGYTAAPKVAYEDKYVHIAYAHPRSTQTSRRLSRQIGINLDGNVSTSVAAATTGFVPDAFDNLVLPT